MTGHREIVIQLTNHILVLYEHELIHALPLSLYEKALKRGKRYKRAEAAKKRKPKSKPDLLDREYSRMFGRI